MQGIMCTKITNYFKSPNILLIIFTSLELFFCNRNYGQKNRINWLACLNWEMAKKSFLKLALTGRGQKSFQLSLP